jgi:hypothetical protein
MPENPHGSCSRFGRRLHGGQGELKYGAARFIRRCPQPAPMGVDDGPANRQPHPCSAGLCGVEGLENAIEMFRMDARPGIAHCHKDAGVVLPVLINSSRGPVSLDPIASTAFSSRFRTTCCN